MTADLAALTGIQVPTGLFIGGEWTTNGRTIGVTDPATEDTLVEIADGTPDDALAAVAAAHQALPAWAATPPRQRAECLRKAWALMIERAEAIARLMVLENGKALRDARGEVTYAAEFFRWYAEEAVRIDGALTTAPSGANRIMVLRQPVGVSVLVTPWNFPAAMATRKIGPALAAGCTVVLKPAKETPLCAFAVADILREAGVPPGVVNVVCTAGGNAPFLIFEDADIDAAIDGAFLAKMRNGGEACTAANRFYVHERVADEFTSRFAARLSKLAIGPGLEPDIDLGPLVNEDTRSKVASLVDGAVSGGGQVVTGGHAPDRKGYFYLPTVLRDLPPDAAILGTEIFGPVAPVVRFSTEDDAIRWANDTEYGLVSYLYTGDLRRALRVSEALDTGMVGVNRGIVSDPAAPFGGVKQSGLGREGGHDGLLEFMESKYIAVDW